jgi:SAM-dependent methyltransferase
MISKIIKIITHKARLFFSRLNIYINSTEPISNNFGHDRGLPIQRYYAEKFLAEHATDIAGTILEIQEDYYTKKFGKTKVLVSNILDIDPNNKRATTHTNLLETSQLPHNKYDCIILTFVLCLVDDYNLVLKNIKQMLRPGGVILCTLSSINMLADNSRVIGEENDYWHFTEKSAKYMFNKIFGANNVSVRSYGNVFSVTKSLYGISSEELSKKKLDFHDNRFPSIVCIRAKNNSN